MYKNKNLFRLSSVLLFSSLGCCFVLSLRVLITHSFRYSYLVWNLLLAWIPYLISIGMNTTIGKMQNRRRIKLTVIGLGFVWLLFYPNAPYILTDFIHIIRVPPYILQETSVVTNNAIVWYDIVLNSSFAFIGHLIGLLSLIICQTVFTKGFNRTIGWLIVFIAMFLGGYGIYLGRFVRINSWHIFTKPFLTTKMVVTNLGNVKALLFTICFAFFIFMTYIVVYSFHTLKHDQKI
jgi:uncharacterized membrane protein